VLEDFDKTPHPAIGILFGCAVHRVEFGLPQGAVFCKPFLQLVVKGFGYAFALFFVLLVEGLPFPFMALLVTAYWESM
jgi:hypothetical protein